MASCASPERSSDQVGQELTAKVLKFDSEKNRVSLGIKQLGDDPWMGVSSPLPEQHPSVRQGDEHRRLRRIRGNRTRHRRLGARVRNGLDQQERGARQGRYAWAKKSKSWCWRSTKTSVASALGMKQCRANPWEEFARELQAWRQGQGPDQVHHRLRHLHWPGCWHRWPGASERPELGTRLAKLPWRNFKKGQEDGRHRVGGGCGTRAHLAWASSRWTATPSPTSRP